PPPRRPAGPAFVPASQQFDLARRQQAQAAAREQQAAAARTPSAPVASSGPSSAGQASAGQAPSSTLKPSGPAQRVLTPKDLEGVGRNDVCPCGSGQKFKKCHGRDL
ncbi:MAG: SEC-C metal-binding domain-containing protein, partial [Planctomycetota bacterium]|nr:SEC-C metal-binding domain-containing protein [Planctomycetota bacterium]